MDIFELKSSLFTGPCSKMKFLDDYGFNNTIYEPDDFKVYGKSAYFSSKSREIKTTSDICKLKSSFLNVFDGDFHRCSFSVSKEWISVVCEQLRACAYLIFSRNPFDCISEKYSSFDSFWKDMQKPSSDITLSTFAYSKRGRQKQYVNIYDCNMNEITGITNVSAGSLVRVCLRWVFYVQQSVDGIQFGFRPEFSGGVMVHELNGICPSIRSPWDWSDIDFESLSIPMYPRFNVKCPPLTVVSEFGDTFKIDMSEHEDFSSALRKFHSLASASEWDGTIHLRTSKSVHVGKRLLVTIFCDRNKDHINWYTDKLFHLETKPCSRVQNTDIPTQPSMVDRKRDADNMDNFAALKTKRQCTLHESDDHKTD